MGHHTSFELEPEQALSGMNGVGDVCVRVVRFGTVRLRVSAKP